MKKTKYNIGKTNLIKEAKEIINYIIKINNFDVDDSVSLMCSILYEIKNDISSKSLNMLEEATQQIKRKKRIFFN